MTLRVTILLFFSQLSYGNPIRSLLQENRLDAAEMLCQQIAVLSPNDTDSLFACAWIHFRLDRLDSGEKILETFRNKSSTAEYQLLTAFSRMKRKKFEEARQTLSALEKEYKGTPIALTALELYAESYEMQGELATAAFNYKSIVSDDKKRARSHWGLARHYLSRGETSRAVLHFEQTAKLWPKHIGSRFNLGLIALNANQLPDAAKWLSQCYKLDKSDPEVLENLGLLFEKKGLLSEAKKYWERTLGLKKDATLAREKLSTVYSKMIDEQIAKKNFRRALSTIDAHGAMLTDQAKLRLQKGIIYRNQKEYEKGSVELLAYLASHPNDPSALRELGICYLNINLIDKAGEYFAKAVTTEPDEGMNHAWLAFVLESKGELSRARDEWKRATELIKDPKELTDAAKSLTRVEKRLQKEGK